MSLFDLQDVCIAIGSIATLDLPMVVDLIGIYGLKGPYCTLTTNDWFLLALSVIPRRSWGDVARRSYHDPLGKSGIVIPEPQWLWPMASCIPEPLRVTQVLDSRFPHGYSAQCVEHTKWILGVRLPKKSTGVKSGFPAVEGQNGHFCTGILNNGFSDHSIQFWKLSRSVRSDRRSEL
ncbi:helicase domain-containing family protein [Dorcoceras hygrometricum]|nr:helicase domain-containing family protein [Dorcoceras hygrometricum]